MLMREQTAENQAMNTADSGPKSRWKRAGVFTAQLQDSDGMLKDAGIDVNDSQKKSLETQHWLELIDGSVAIKSLSDNSFNDGHSENTDMARTVSTTM
jgi:hypothetical protein